MASASTQTATQANTRAHILNLPKEIRDMIYNYVYPDLSTSDLLSDVHHNQTLRLALPQTCRQLRLELLDLACANGTLALYTMEHGFTPVVSPSEGPTSTSTPLPDSLPIHLIKRVSLSLNLADLPPRFNFHLNPTTPLTPVEAVLTLCTCTCTFQRRTSYWVTKFRTIILTLLTQLPSLERIAVYHCHIVRLTLEEMWDALQFPDVMGTMFDGEARYGGPWCCTYRTRFAWTINGAAGRGEDEGATCGESSSSPGGDDNGSSSQGVECYVMSTVDSMGDVVRVVEMAFWDSWEVFNLPCVRYRRDGYGIPCLE